MKKTNRYELEGIIIDIPAYYDETSGRYIEEYPDFLENPIYTREGHQLILCIEDACEFAEPITRGRLIDCSDCKYFERTAPTTLFGFCRNDMRKSK